ncbi:MAG TPA: hypothetical protein VGP12_08950 [Nitrosospira sp.]|nr:hypothetical protein [Nitrosospira sp.]
MWRGSFERTTPIPTFPLQGRRGYSGKVRAMVAVEGATVAKPEAHPYVTFSEADV